MALGISFSPGSQDPQRTGPTGVQDAAPLQQAIQLLSLRLPRVVGATSPIPAPLLQGTGSQGQPDATGNPLLDVLRRLLNPGGGGGFAPPSQNTPAALGEGPSPRVIPGAGGQPVPQPTGTILPPMPTPTPPQPLPPPEFPRHGPDEFPEPGTRRPPQA